MACMVGSVSNRRTRADSRGGRSTASAKVSNLEQMLELGSKMEPDANDQHIVRIVDWLLQYAFEQRASDIHIEPRRDVGNVRFRTHAPCSGSVRQSVCPAIQ